MPPKKRIYTDAEAAIKLKCDRCDAKIEITYPEVGTLVED